MATAPSPRRRLLKESCKRRLLKTRDHLADRARDQARGIACLTGLHHVAWRANKPREWVHQHVMGMVYRRPELARYGREALYVPDGSPKVRSTGAQS
jgi:hypothetical protein